MLPVRAGVDRFPDAVADVDRFLHAADVAGAHINDVGVGARDGDGADGFLVGVVEDGFPGVAAACAFPDAASGCAEVIGGGVAGDAGDGGDTSGAEGTDLPPA